MSNKINQRGVVCILCLFTFVLCLSVSFATPIKKVSIAIVSDGIGPRSAPLFELFKQEIRDLNEGEFEITFSEKYLDGEWSLPQIRDNVQKALQDPSLQLVVTLGVVASHVAATFPEPPKSVIAPFVIDRNWQKLPWSEGKSGVRNLNYLTSSQHIPENLEIFRQVVPFSHLSVLVDSLTLSAIPSLKTVAEEVSRTQPFTVSLVEVKQEDPLAWKASLPPQTQAVLFTPLFFLSEEELKQSVEFLIEKRIPAFSLHDYQEVEQGLLATLSSKNANLRLARRVALNVQRILLGEVAGELSVEVEETPTLTLNMATARALSVWPSWEVLANANLLHEAADEGAPSLTLVQAVEQALVANIDLKATAYKVDIAKQQAKGARANLLPRVDARLTTLRRDADYAKATQGLQTERETASRVDVSQLLYSDSAWTNWIVQKRTERAQELGLDQKRLDTILEAATAYLNVLSGQAVERIRKSNVMLTRSNLERARERKAIGVANPSEVYRWESEIANRQTEWIEAQAQTRQAIVALNRIMHRPLETTFSVSEETLSNPLFLISDPRFMQYVKNPRSVSVFKEFLVEEGLKQSPELAIFREELEAQKRQVLAAKRAFFWPTFSFQGNWTEKLRRKGAGTDQDPIIIGGMPIDLSPKFNNTTWEANVIAALPLFTSGARHADLEKAEATLTQLYLELESTREQVEQRIRNHLYQTDASYPSIELLQGAREAARKNLELVKDQYQRGVVSIIDLIDGQNAALISQEKASNTVYAFLIDYLKVQRAVGQFDFLKTEAQREEWLKRLEDYFQHHS